MFVQVIRGKVKDPAAVQAAWDDWKKNIKPGAKGYLGSTSGVADDGTAVTVARFESEESARENSERPEQSEWWKNVGSKAHGDDVTFMDFTDAETFLGGGSDKAGFVQLMFGKVKDVAADKEFGRGMEEQVKSVRPDIIGGVNCYMADGRFAAINYFTSEREAREGEKKEMPGVDMQVMMQNIDGEIEFVDLRNPQFDSA